jgi:hypothetical protein
MLQGSLWFRGSDVRHGIFHFKNEKDEVLFNWHVFRARGDRFLDPILFGDVEFLIIFPRFF